MTTMGTVREREDADRYVILQFEQGEWRPVGYPQMKYPNIFEHKTKALDVAWGLYEGYNEVQVRRMSRRARPKGWRLPSVMHIVRIRVPPLPFVETIPGGE